MEMPHQSNISPTKDRRSDSLGDFKYLPDEVICSILDHLTPPDLARLACVSSFMYIFCNEEPLWMSACLKKVSVQIQYKGSWKKTTLHLENLPNDYIEVCRKPLQFDGFSSSFLYRRLYRCHTTLDEFSFDDRNVERIENISAEQFHHEYDGIKPVLLNGLADTWPARSAWTIDQLVPKYGDITFKISSSLKMKFKDYVSYMKQQHDEDPLYIFDDKFGESAPGLLKDYTVPQIFQEDFFDVLEKDRRPPFRWLVIGPARSGASWHVDPALTSAWNTLLCGRKRWALYPPGTVPLGVTVNVDDDDGDISIDTPSSLQWWLDFYPLLANENKPIECTQLPGETIFVPSGWWHCVLNLETTIAVTQNFVNSRNFEFVCLDMAPGYCHRGVCRAGLLALDEGSLEIIEKNTANENDNFKYSDLTKNEKDVRILRSQESENGKETSNGSYNLWEHDFSYDINYLAMFRNSELDHFSSPWNLDNSIGPRELREWLSKLWLGNPGMREMIWKVYVMDEYVIKIFAEGGLSSSIFDLGTELEFYSALSEVNSPLKNHIPNVLASGILHLENGSYKIDSWDGKTVPSVIRNCDLIPEKLTGDAFPFGVRSKKLFEYKKDVSPEYEPDNSEESTIIFLPYLITKRCKGKIFAKLRDVLPWEDVLNLASFLGEQLRNLHMLPYPSFSNSALSEFEQNRRFSFANGMDMEFISNESYIPVEWKIFVRTLIYKKKNASSQLSDRGGPIPKTLIEKVDAYLPDDFMKLLSIYEENGKKKVGKPWSWIHKDIMDDNIYMECKSCSNGIPTPKNNGSANGHSNGGEVKSWRPSYILDFSNLCVGDSIYDLIPLHLDVFRGNSTLLKQFLKSYKLPLMIKKPKQGSMDGGDDKFGRLSYHAMCFCILHDENVLATLFKVWKELRTAESWEEVELKVWGELNDYEGFP
ncbi:F-box protein At1g78280-like isoform X2 [Hibiscus syriacus]|uniref:F-box protein At1g78280-like isoform X2 n=1 Tax=Hibiscus syriacus TaxID=106335 RepID=UPI001921F094|nr:F-box protein At1g78280-like isoform X2 [Hibiscus syriacus]